MKVNATLTGIKLFILVFFYSIGFSQAFFVENFSGGISGYSTTGSVSANSASASTGYTYASGGNNVLMQDCGSSGFTSIVIGGINTVGKTGIQVGFGQRRSGAFSAAVTFAWSSDGITWNTVSGVPTPTTTWNFYETTLPTGAEGQTNLRLRWSFNATNTTSCSGSPPNYRIDDVRVGQNSNLPIELLSFTGKAVNNAVVLHWRTVNERDNKYMEVQRSEDSKRFVPIGRVEGAGTVSTPRDYTFTDHAPLRSMNYYRLRQVDFDETETYHPVIAVFFEGQKLRSPQVLVYPTFSREQVQLVLATEAEEDSEIHISDFTGRVVQRLLLPAGTQQYILKIDQLPSGHYVVAVRRGQDTSIGRFVKE